MGKDTSTHKIQRRMTLPLCADTINKTNMKYGALMCVVNGQIPPNEGVWMQEAQRCCVWRQICIKAAQVAEYDDGNYDSNKKWYSV